MDDYRILFIKYIDQSVLEIEATPDELLFKPVSGVVNTVGNLGLHIAGNLSHFIGVGIGQQEYKRNREYEFEARNVSKQSIIENLSYAKSLVNHALSGLDSRRLIEKYPDFSPWKDQTLGFVLSALLAHLCYHVGQMNYLSRILRASTQ
jgi:hypothetical protein